MLLDETADKDLSKLDGGGGINTDVLPRKKDASGCHAILPHEFLRVNTVFEVAHEAGKHTAWCDKHHSYDIVNGPTGRGRDDLYTPEIRARFRPARPTATGLPAPRWLPRTTTSR